MRSIRILAVMTISLVFLVATAAQSSGTSHADSICKNERWMDLGFSNQGQCVRAEARGLLWVLNEDFLTFPDQANPNPDRYDNPDTWSYLAAEAETINDPSTYESMRFYNVGVGQHAGQQGWEFGPVAQHSTPWAYPSVHSSRSGSPVSLHPGFPGRDPEYAIVAWTSPFAGSVQITGSVWDGDEAGLPGSGCPTWLVDGVTWEIRSGPDGRIVAQGQIADGGHQSFPQGLAVDVSPGSEIWFAIGPDSNFYCDATRTSIVLVGEVSRR